MLGRGDAMALEKPASVARSPYKSAKWDEIVEGRNFTAANIPALTLLVQWYQVMDTAMDDMEAAGELQLVYENENGDIKPFPQVALMKQASAEIRALNKQLGINDEARGEAADGGKPGRITVFSCDRAQRRARAANQG